MRTSRTETSGNTATEFTMATTKRSEHSARLTEQKTAELKMTEWKNQNIPLLTLRPGGSIHTSLRSVSSAARLRDLKSREELARLELQLARIKFERLRVQEKVGELDKELETSQVQSSIQTSNSEDLDKELGDRSSQVQSSIQTSHLKENECMFPNVETEDKVDDLDKELETLQVQNCIQTSNSKDLDKELEDRSTQVQNCIQTSSLEDLDQEIKDVYKETSQVQNCIQTTNAEDLDKELVNEYEETLHLQNCIQTSHLKETEFILLKQNTEDIPDDLDKKLTDGTSYVQNYIQASSTTGRDETEYIIPEQDFKESQGIMNNEQAMMSSIQVKTTSDAIAKTFDNRITRVVHPAQPKIQPKNQELPYYEENSAEWLVFKVDHGDTSKIYRLRQSKTRVRKAIEEVAKNTCKILSYYDVTPDQVRCVRSLRTVRYKESPPRSHIVAQITIYLKLRCYNYAAAKAEKKKELLDLETTYTATEEDEGGGML